MIQVSFDYYHLEREFYRSYGGIDLTSTTLKGNMLTCYESPRIR